jgi:hypothetical protein
MLPKPIANKAFPTYDPFGGTVLTSNAHPNPTPVQCKSA